ncbi:MAG: hypothetical protein SNJ54_15555 [Anaerolineae bacterium]
MSDAPHPLSPRPRAAARLGRGGPPGARQIVVADIDLVQTSCGFAVPLMDYVGQRDTLIKWAETKGDDALNAYRAEKNVTSLDQLPTHLGVDGQR